MLAAILLCVVLAALAAFQVALIAGAPWGEFAWGGQERVLSPAKKRGSVVSIVVYAIVAALFLARAGVLATPVPQGVLVVAAWVLVGYFALGVVLNAISRSRKERFVMTPVALVIAVLCAIVAAR